MYRIFTTEEFDRKFANLDKSIKNSIKSQMEQLKTNPYIGKPLGYKFFREKKVGNYRFYYLIYDDYLAVFSISISGKKDQQKVIDTIKSLIPHYREEIRKKLDEMER